MARLWALACLLTIAGAQLAPAPAPESGACEGTSTPDLYWLVANLETNVSASIDVESNEYGRVPQEIMRAVERSVVNATGLTFDLLSDLHFTPPESTTQRQLVAKLFSAPTAAQEDKLAAWAVEAGSSPSTISIPEAATPGGSGDGEAGTVRVLNATVTQCVPATSYALLNTLAKLSLAQKLAFPDSSSSAINCLNRVTKYLVAKYVIYDVDEISPAGGGNITYAPVYSINGGTMSAPRTQLLDEDLRSLWLEAQRQLALQLAPWITSLEGPMWANGSIAAFALPVNASKSEPDASRVIPELGLQVENTTAEALLLKLEPWECLPTYFSTPNDLTDLEPYSAEGCPVDADGNDLLPPLSGTYDWYALLNETLSLPPSNMSESSVQEALDGLERYLADVLSHIPSSMRPNGSRIETFIWPSDAVGGQLKVSSRVQITADGDEPSPKTQALLTSLAAQALVNYTGMPGAYLFDSHLELLTCTPAWWSYGSTLAKYASAGAPPPPPAPPASPDPHFPPPPAGESGSGTNIAAIVGGTVAACVVVAALVGGVVWVRRRRRRRAHQLPLALKSLKGQAGLDDSWLISYKDLKIMGKPLGEGGYGTVYAAQWLDNKVAVKRFAAEEQQASGSTSGKLVDSKSLTGVAAALQREAAIMASIRHPNCIMYLGAVLDPPCLVMELCSKGSLLEVLHRAKEPLPWTRRLSMVYDAAKGMQYLHARQPPIIHRDLKSPNLLVGSHWQVKVSDFGLSRAMLEQGAAVSSIGGPGNPRWTAPEVLAGGHFVAASDVYSFGIILWELMGRHNRLPWEEVVDGPWRIAALVTGGQRPEVPPASECQGIVAYGEYVQLMTDCWQTDPGARPSFTDVCARLRDILRTQMKQGKQSGSKTSRRSFTQRLRSFTQRHSEPNGAGAEQAAAPKLTK